MFQIGRLAITYVDIVETWPTVAWLETKIAISALITVLY